MNSCTWTASHESDSAKYAPCFPTILLSYYRPLSLTLGYLLEKQLCQCVRKSSDLSYEYIWVNSELMETHLCYRLVLCTKGFNAFSCLKWFKGVCCLYSNKAIKDLHGFRVSKNDDKPEAYRMGWLLSLYKKKKKRYSDYITRSGWYLAEGTECHSVSLVCNGNILMSSVTLYVENSNATTVAQV